MRWSDEITLIALSDPPERVDANGVKNPKIETRTTVFGNRKPVGYSEFYKAELAGHQTEIKFDVHTEEYTGQQEAEYGGKRYGIDRTYESKNGETTELTLSDLKKKGGGGNGTV